MKHSFKKEFRRFLCFLMTFIMILTSMPVHLLAANVDHNNLSNNKSEIINNKTPVKVAKPEADKTAADLIKNPPQPKIYTLRTDYKVQKGDKYEINYQPYVASVGEGASDAEKAKVKQEITLPDLAGYDKSQLGDSYTIDYNTVKESADGKNKKGDEANGFRYSADQDFRYKAKPNSIKIKHLFQDMKDFTKYTNPNGSVGEEGQLITTQNGNTGSTMEVSPLNEDRRKGFVPESDFITMRVPEDATDFVLEYRYNRAHYNVDFDTMGGTALPTRTYYYDQEIPKIEKENIPTKIGCDFLGWKPSHELQSTDGKTTYKANQIINKADGKPALDLDVHLKMPALLLGTDIKSRERLKFTAVWKDKDKADYAIQFWTEKADHADGASLQDKYEYMGTRVYKDKDTGSTPELDKEPVKGLKFPDLDQARLNKIWANSRFNRSHDLYLNKFFVYNKDLTDTENIDPKTKVTKTVSATGKTVYNIYYDRQVYDLYFTKSNAQPEKNTIYPEIWGYDKAKGEAVMLGGPGKPYHYKARFNEMMYKWPNDAKQTKGFTPGYQSFGWGPNYTRPNWPLHLDTPPYRLNADEFLDMANYDSWGGYTKHIDKGDGKTIDLDRLDFTTLSFGIKQDKPSIPHHMDFWMDGFKKDETIIRYDLVRTKADTIAPGYGHSYPKVTGFTPKDYEPNNPQSAWPVIREGSEKNGRVNEDGINELNDERDEITPNTCGTYYNNYGTKLPIGQLDFISVFFSDADEYGDAREGGQKFTENGYLQFHYKRNKYPLRFNYDPSITRDDSYFNEKNSIETFYEFPLKVLNPDLVDSKLDRDDKEYFKDDPKNLLDNPENLQKLGLSDLVFTDPKDGKLKVKRPDGLSDQMVFKGWALDPAGTKLVWENPKETMPFHPLNLYAKWGEPDYKLKVTFDPDGGKLRNIKEEKLTTERKKIQEGDIGQEEVNTYAKKGYLKEDPTTKDGKQIFTVIQRQKLVEPVKPEKKGYDFMGWEVVRYKKNDKGDYTDEVDNSYRNKYGVPELYTFGNDVVGPVYLKAIWNPNQRVDVDVYHYFLDKDYNLDKTIRNNPQKETLEDKRANYLVAATGDGQSDKYILAPHKELEEKLTGDLKTEYEEYNKRVKLNNTYFQTFRVEPEKILDKETNAMVNNPKLKDNVFKFFYRPFRQREYTVNYLDEQGKAAVDKFYADLKLTPTDGLEGAELLEANKANKEKFDANKSKLDEIIKKHKIVEPEAVKNGNRHFDARNYREIPGWTLTSNPQQQLFFDLNEDTNEFLGINGTGSDQIFFYYKDVRVIEVPGDKNPPEGYVRVTYKIDEKDKGGAFTDKDGKSVTELHYDVIKGLKSDLLPVPQELKDGEEKVAGKYYVTPETGKKFTKWDKAPLLNKNTIINEAHTFTAYFEWSGLSASGLVRTEAYKDSNGKWTNNFAPTIEDLKKQLVWREKDEVKPLPAGAVIKLYDEKGNELTKDDQVYELVNEKKAADKDELVRTVNVKAKVTFTDGKDPQELDIPITVYKNVYEALNKAGDKPLFLKEAEGKEAKDGGLKDITGNYVKVTVQPTEKNTNKDAKVYYVNPKAWVNIPEVEWSQDDKDKTDFLKWTADKKGQNENKEENGIFDFSKRHKFTDEETLIKPLFTNDVVEKKKAKTSQKFQITS
nr:InlB B-repeat-containing protein [Finegoldia magna]